MPTTPSRGGGRAAPRRARRTSLTRSSKGARYARQFEPCAATLDPPAAGGAPRTFDLGCGLGSWLDSLEDGGWQTYGLEGLRSLLGLAGLVIEEHLETAEWDPGARGACGCSPVSPTFAANTPLR